MLKFTLYLLTLVIIQDFSIRYIYILILFIFMEFLIFIFNFLSFHIINLVIRFRIRLFFNLFLNPGI